MKIFLANKKTILIVSLIFIIIILLLFYTIFCFSYPAEPVSSCNASVSNDFMDKIKNLTKGEEKIAYLTFDDGPRPSVTPKILDILKDENIKASFFVIGRYVDESPEIVIRAYEEGHYIANHGYSHNNSILYKDAESFIAEVQKTDLAISNAIGVDNYCSHIFRFPNGFMSSAYKAKKEEAVTLLQEMDYAYIDWNCLTNDSVKKYTNSQLLENLKETSENKNTLVVLMHDTKDVNDSSLVLKDCIDYLKSQGYEFKNFYSLM